MNTEKRQAVRDRFEWYFAAHGFMRVEGAPLIPDDQSLLYSNATIVPVKTRLLRKDVPSPGLYIDQECLRTQNLQLDLNTQPEYLSHFRMLGLLMPANVDMPLALRLIYNYLITVEDIPADKILLKTSAHDPFISRTWDEMAVGSLRVDDSHGREFYEWTYGVEGWTGEGVTISLAQDDGSFADIGNIIRMEERGVPIGYEFGFGIETFLARKLGVNSPFITSQLHDIVESSNMNYAVQDAAATVAVMYMAGSQPGRAGRGALVRTAINRLLDRLEFSGADFQRAALLVSAYAKASQPLDPRRATEAAQKAVLEMRRVSQNRDTRIANFKDFACNQLRLAEGGRPQTEALTGWLGRRARTRYGLNAEITDKLLEELMKDKMMTDAASLPAHVVKVPELTDESARNALRADNVNLVFAERDSPDWAEALAVVVAEATGSFQFWFLNEDVDGLEGKLATALQELVKSRSLNMALTNDIVQLAKTHVALTGDRQPFVSLRTIDATYFKEGATSVSSHMHIDTATVTLTCTYVGEGPEWTPNDNILREKFLDKKIQAVHEPLNQVVRDPELVYPSHAFEIAVLKGEIRMSEDEGTKEFLSNFLAEDDVRPYNIGQGLLHRGPGMRHGKRLVLTVSSMRIPEFAKV